MGELDKKKRKHNHTLTDLLKVAIFSLVMLAPFLSIGVRCGYVMWNKNAKDSYSRNYNYDYQLVNNFEINKNYLLKRFNDSQTKLSDYLSIIPLSMNINNTTLQDWYNANEERIAYIRVPGNTLYFYDVDKTQLNNFNARNIDFTFEFTSLDSILLITNVDSFYLITQDSNNYLDNAFSYSVSQISNDPVFNWTRNTGIYQPINAMVSGLEIENNTLQILLAYWSLMTAVYIVFDIIIFCFTKLTHFVNE